MKKITEENDNIFKKGKFLKIILLVITLISIYLIFVPPYIGIANNGSFQNITQKVGIDYSYNAWDVNNYEDTFFHYIVNSFNIIEPVDNGSFSIFEFHVSFSKFIAELFSKTGNYDIRYMGLSNLIVYILVIGLFFYAISNYSKQIIIFFGIITLFIASDSYILQYFNSFYTEVGTLFYLMAFFSLCLIFIRNESKTRLICLFLEILIAVFITCIKQQNILIVLPISIILLLQVYEIFIKKYFIVMNIKLYVIVNMFLCITLFVPIYYMRNLDKDSGNIASYNVIMNDILELSEKPEVHLNKLCYNNEVDELLLYIGQTSNENVGFTKYGVKFNRINEVKILIKEPSIAYKLLERNANKLFRTDDLLGNFLKEENMPNAKNQVFSIWSNIKHKAMINSLWFYILIVVFASAVSTYKIIKKKVKVIIEYHLLLIICIINILQFVAITFADSFNNDIRDFFIINLEFDVIFICLLYYLINHIISFKNFLNQNLKVTLKIHPKL